MSGHDPEENQSLNDSITKKSRALFDQASEHPGPATGNRLRLMRRDALAGGTRRAMPYRWLPLGAVAATILGIGMSWWLPQRNAIVAPSEISSNATDQDLLPEDDAEIYDWLGEAPVAVNDGKTGSQ
jgi:hypothetical protein